jgi:hypothetical protein
VVHPADLLPPSEVGLGSNERVLDDRKLHSHWRTGCAPSLALASGYIDSEFGRLDRSRGARVLHRFEASGIVPDARRAELRL